MKRERRLFFFAAAMCALLTMTWASAGSGRPALDAAGADRAPESGTGEFESKVTLCHHPPENPANPQTITVGQSAVPTHLAHGDSFGACSPAVTAEGAIVVLEQGNPSDPFVPAALIEVDPTTGTQHVLSSGGLLAAGHPSGLAYDKASDSFFVVGRDARLVQISRTTGQQTLITTLPVTGAATGIAVEANGDLLVTDYGGSSIYDAHGRVLQVRRDGSAVSVLAEGQFLDSIAAIAIQIDDLGSPIVSGFGAPLSSVIRVDPTTGQQLLISSASTGKFYDFALCGSVAYVALSSPGFPNSLDRVAELNLETGALTTVVDGLQRVLDVDIDAHGRLVVLDQCRSLTSCAGSPVVYRTNLSGGLDVVSENGFMYVPGRLTIVSPSSPSRKSCPSSR